MMGMLVLKEQLKAFYAKNSALVNAAARFLVAFAAFYLINKNAGFMPKLNSPVIALLLGVVCSVLPYGAIALLAGAFLLAQLCAASLEVAVLTLVFLLIVVMLYYGFQPGDSVLLLLTPILFFLKVPFAMALLAGLAGSLFSLVPMSCGIFIYYVILYVKQNSSFLAGSEQAEMTQVFTQVVKSLLINQTMLVMITACCLGILVVRLIKNLSVNYSWAIAIMAGTMVQLVVIFFGDFKFNISFSVVELTVSMILSAVIAFVYHFLVFTVDYSRTEYVQFEDDDYYYYVKAVPKIAVSAPEIKVQKITTRKNVKRQPAKERQ